MQFKNRFDQKYRSSPNIFGNEPMPLIKETLKYISTGKALDLGVGNGRNTLFLLQKSFQVTGVDMSQEGIDIIRKQTKDNPHLNLVVSDVTKFKSDEKYDLIVAIGLLHFLNTNQVHELISNMKSWTKKGGFNVIGARMTQNFRNDLPHVFQPNELKKLYSQTSWSIKEYKENLGRNAKIASIIAQKL